MSSKNKRGVATIVDDSPTKNNKRASTFCGSEPKLPLVAGTPVVMALGIWPLSPLVFHSSPWRPLLNLASQAPPTPEFTQITENSKKKMKISKRCSS
jgi:hypothetical protein